MAELWVEPSDLERRDLYWGAGGRELAPASDVDYRFLKLDRSGHSRGYWVEAPDGRHWKVKVGDEAQAEIVVSRVLWAIGYHQAPMYFLPEWRMTGGPAGALAPGRFRLESGFEKKGSWSWRKSPFAGSRPLRGLLIANLVLENWDLAASNNRIYRLKKPRGQPATWYVVQDVGAALGKSFFPIGSRNKIDDFESQDLITGVSAGHPQFAYYSVHSDLLDDVKPADVVWVCRLLSRLSDRQWSDAFRAAQYPDGIATRYLKKIHQKLQQGLALEAASGNAR